MATAIPFEMVFQTTTGVPVSGVKVYVYAPTTTTPRTAYSDTGLSVPIANPFVGDSAGYVDFYLSSDLGYRIVAKSADDSITYYDQEHPSNISGAQPVDATLTALAGLVTADGDFIEATGVDTFRTRKATRATYAALTAIGASARFDDMLVYVASRATDGDGGDGWWRFDASSSATANGGTILAPDAGTGRWIRQYTDALSVRWFGALGDNSANDTTAIQATIDAAEAAYDANSLGVYFVDFPNGVYRFTALTVERSGIYLRSQSGARLVKTSTTGNGIYFNSGAGRIFQNGVIGLVLAGAGTHTAGAFIYANNVSNFIVEDVTTSSFPAAIWRGLRTNNAIKVNLENAAFQNCLEDGAAFEDSGDVHILNSRSDVNAGNGFVFDRCSGVYCWGSNAFGNGVSAFVCRETVPSVLILKNDFHFYTDCIGDSSGSHNWNISALRQSVLKGCWGSTQTGTATNVYGFAVTGATEVTFDSCIAITNNGSGMLCESSKITILGGSYSENGFQAGSPYRDGIVLGSGADATIIGVLMNDVLTKTGSFYQQYGLRVLAGVTRLTLKDCDLRSNVVGPYTFAAIPTIFQEANNVTGESASVASASTLTLPIIGTNFTITGTTQINAIANYYTGRKVTLTFAASVTVAVTALNGAMSATAGSVLSLTSDGTDWQEVSRAYASGSVAGTSLATVAWQLRGENENIHTVEDGAFVELAGGSGIIMVVDASDSTIGCFLVGAAVTYKLGGAAKFVTGGGGAGEVGVSFGTTSYKITNNLGSSKQFWIFAIAARNGP
jgi:hypothetical protein